MIAKETQLRFDAIERELPASQPLATIETLRSLSGRSEDDIKYLYESGLLRFAFDLSSPGSKRKEVRVFFKCFFDYLRRDYGEMVRTPEAAQGAKDLHAVVLACIPPGKGAVKLSTLSKWWIVSSTHLHDLLSDTTLVKVPGQLLRAKQTPGLDRASVAEFLKSRRII